AGFHVLYVDSEARASGGLATLQSRANDIRSFVSAGGGLVTDNGSDFGAPDFSWVPVPTLPAGDVYRLTASVGQLLQFATATPADGPGQFVNTLDPRLRVLDSAGAALASDDNSAPDGRNAQLSFTAPATGTYFIEISPSPATATPTSGE